jgi:hypothetical protein
MSANFVQNQHCGVYRDEGRGESGVIKEKSAIVRTSAGAMPSVAAYNACAIPKLDVPMLAAALRFGVMRISGLV